MPARAHLDRRAAELGGDFELVDDPELSAEILFAAEKNLAADQP